jgi:hypothetical protein
MNHHHIILPHYLKSGVKAKCDTSSKSTLRRGEILILVHSDLRVTIYNIVQRRQHRIKAIVKYFTWDLEKYIIQLPENCLVASMIYKDTTDMTIFWNKYTLMSVLNQNEVLWQELCLNMIWNKFKHVIILQIFREEPYYLL